MEELEGRERGRAFRFIFALLLDCSPICDENANRKNISLMNSGNTRIPAFLYDGLLLLCMQPTFRLSLDLNHRASALFGPLVSETFNHVWCALNQRTIPVLESLASLEAFAANRASVQASIVLCAYPFVFLKGVQRNHP